MLSTRLSRWATDHPFETDVAFAVLVGAMTMLGFVVADVSGSEQEPDAIGGLLILGQTASFAFRRRAPIASLLGVVAFTVSFWIADYASNFEAFSLLAVYAATAHGGEDRGRVWRIVGSVVAGVSVVAVLGVLSPSEDLPAAAVVGIAALHVTAAIAGEIVYDRRKRVFELEQRAVRAEAERGLLARQAVLDERARIARDLHDVVAHGMSVMVVQAGAAERVVASDPAEAAKALDHIQQAGREALSEMRRMLDVLRSEPNGDRALAPQPTMDDLAQIVQHCSDSGIPTELIVDGERATRSAGQEMAAYRIVQEALTNVIKHAGRPAHAVVRVQYRPEHIQLEVIDDGAGTTDRELAAASGHGLVGMRERVDLYNGTLRFGPRPGGGFRVAATVPFDRTPANAT
ncbi:sensor histidine kinase [Ilumatobacter sp.]|uniref:sensor histidine kinase n=1 Tax=Ilumatobacter sp. TaxID=1967498 RepID=UPI003AF42021